MWLVIALNATMFVVEMTAGHLAKSQALQADALDFAGDALTYGVSLAVIGASLRARTNAALFKGVSLLALLTNLASVFLLVRYKDGEANVRSVWLCSRNDAIGNVAVMFTALGVWGTATGWPDLIVAPIMAGLFLSSAFQIVRQALEERREMTQHEHKAVRCRLS